MKIYLASPFFTKYQRNSLLRTKQLIDEFLKKNGNDTEWFIPMEHFIENGNALPNVVWSEKVFRMDKQAIDSCDIVIALDFGFSADSGTAWEIGYAYAKQKEVCCINMGNGGCRSLMIIHGCSKYFASFDDFCKNFLSDYKLSCNPIPFEIK